MRTPAPVPPPATESFGSSPADSHPAMNLRISRGWSFGQGHCKAHGPESYGYQGLPKGSVRPITLGTGSVVASTMEGQAPWAHYSLNTQHSLLRHSLYVIPAIGDNIHHRSIFNVAIEGIRVRPLQIPPVLNGNYCVLSRQHVRQAKCSVTIALVSPEQRDIILRVLGDQDNHCSWQRLALAPRGAADLPLDFGQGHNQTVSDYNRACL